MNNRKTSIRQRRTSKQYQMTFGHLRQARPKHRANVTVDKSEKRRLKRQAVVIFDMLRVGPVWTSELSLVAKQYNARIREIREMLKPQGLTVDIVAGKPNGDNLYKIRPIHGSKYQAKLMKRQKQNPRGA